MTAPRTDRIVGLDAWRAGLLLGGILLHGSIGLPGNALFGAIDIVSQTFRMGSFFAIAGALSALSIARAGPGEWMLRRITRLGIPLTVSMLVFPPFIWSMVRTYGWAEATPPLPFDWYHLWFLVALLLYSLALHRLVAIGLDDRIAAGLDRWSAGTRSPVSVVILATACATALLFAVTPVAASTVLTPPYFFAYRNVQLIAGYLPMFLLGVFAVRAPKFGATLLDGWRIAMAVVALIAAIYALWFLSMAPQMTRLDPAHAAAMTATLRFVAGALCPPAAFVLILKSAIAIRRIPDRVARLSDASYTIYLLHLPLAAAINLPLRTAGVDPLGCYIAAVIGSGSLSYLVHRAFVRRSDTLRLLLNGQPMRRRRTAQFAKQSR